MSKFLKFNIVDSGALATQGTELVNVDQIQSVSYVVGTGVLSIILKGSIALQKGYAIANDGSASVPNVNYGYRVISITVRTTKDGSAGIPTITNGAKSPQKAVYAAMTANPGGVQSTVQLGLDEAATPIQMYFSDFAVSTEEEIVTYA
jgi:hypothetical protein